MKTITRLFLVGLIALGMTACSNEDEVKFEGKAESTVSVRVVPSSNGPVVRTIGNLDGNGILPEGLVAESAIKSLEVFLFSGESPDGYGTVTDGTLEVTGIATHIGPKTMVVVANANIGVANAPSLTALKAITRDLPVADILTSGLAMTAEPVSLSLVAGLNQYGYAIASGVNNLSTAKLPLTRVNARVAIVAANIGTLPAEQQAIFDELKDVQEAMFNVPKKTNLFGTSLATNADYLFGEAWPSSLNSYTVGTANGAFLDGTVTFPIVKTAAPFYYVNENTSAEVKEQMMIVLRGKPYKGGVAVVADGLYTDAAGYTYYAVWVNATRDGYSYAGDGTTGDSKILRNTQYNITLTINKIGNPNIDPPVSATVDVLVSVAPWLVVDQTVVWN